jgi:hypothetical protein
MTGMKNSRHVLLKAQPFLRVANGSNDKPPSGYHFILHSVELEEHPQLNCNGPYTHKSNIFLVSSNNEHPQNAGIALPASV